MQQFTVPQFIDVEDKIIGPITTRQFLILLAAAILIALFYRIFDFSLFLVTTIAVALIAFVFSFVKIHGRPFHYFLLNFTQTLKRPALRVWQLIDSTPAIVEDDEPVKQEYIPTKNINLKTSHLDQVSLMVDTYGQYQGDDLVERKKNTDARK